MVVAKNYDPTKQNGDVYNITFDFELFQQQVTYGLTYNIHITSQDALFSELQRMFVFA